MIRERTRPCHDLIGISAVVHVTIMVMFHSVLLFEGTINAREVITVAPRAGTTGSVPHLGDPQDEECFCLTAQMTGGCASTAADHYSHVHVEMPALCVLRGIGYPLMLRRYQSNRDMIHGVCHCAGR